MDASINSETEDRMGMSEEHWAIFKRLTSGYGDQDENGVDLSLLRENLKLTPIERLRKLQLAVGFFKRADRSRDKYKTYGPFS